MRIFPPVVKRSSRLVLVGRILRCPSDPGPEVRRTDPTAGCIEFLDRRTNLRVLSHIDAHCMMSKVVYRPEAGMLILFPSCLRHWVYPNAAEAERVSIAFNARHVRRGQAGSPDPG